MLLTCCKPACLVCTAYQHCHGYLQQQEKTEEELPHVQVQPGYVDHKTLDSVDLLIMWDGQYPTPAQNALAAVPYIDLSWRQYLTRATSIKHNFVPVLDVFLMVLLKSSFLSAADVQAFGEAIMQMWRYFQIYDWERTWASPQVCLVCASVSTLVQCL
jgi:hypothetical protein